MLDLLELSQAVIQSLRKSDKATIAESFIIFRNFNTISQQQQSSSIKFPFGAFHPCFGDRNSESGSLDVHYFQQDLWVAQRIFRNNPMRHCDIGSRIDGFVAHVASFRALEVFDIRQLTSTITNVSYTQCDLMSEIPSTLCGYTDSLSCLHALEHFGLGRYGDSIQFEGHVIGFQNLLKILKPGGTLYLSVPIGPQRIEFDAHRVFSVNYLIDELFATKVQVSQFSFINDQGVFHENVPLTQRDVSANFGCQYGCGIFELKKTT